MTHVQVASDLPSWIDTKIIPSLLADETEFIQLGYEEEVEFLTLEFDPPRPSYYNTWPDEFAGSVDLQYKVARASLEMVNY